MKHFSLCLAGLFLAAALQAETLYVTDSFRIPLRTGNTNAYRIIAELKTGTAVEVLETDADSGYSRIKTGRGTEGWVLTRYLVSEPIAAVKLAQAERKLKQLSEQRAEMRDSQTDLQQLSEQLQQDNQALKELNDKLVNELTYIKEVSGNAVTINERNQELIETNQQLQNQIELLSADNERLKDDSKKEFFLYGATTIVVGIVLGLAIPSIRRRRKDPGWI